MVQPNLPQLNWVPPNPTKRPVDTTINPKPSPSWTTDSSSNWVVKSGSTWPLNMNQNATARQRAVAHDNAERRTREYFSSTEYFINLGRWQRNRSINYIPSSLMHKVDPRRFNHNPTADTINTKRINNSFKSSLRPPRSQLTN